MHVYPTLQPDAWKLLHAVSLQSLMPLFHLSHNHMHINFLAWILIHKESIGIWKLNQQRNWIQFLVHFLKLFIDESRFNCYTIMNSSWQIETKYWNGAICCKNTLMSNIMPRLPGIVNHWFSIWGRLNGIPHVIHVVCLFKHFTMILSPNLTYIPKLVSVMPKSNSMQTAPH